MRIWLQEALAGASLVVFLASTVILSVVAQALLA